VVIGRKNGHCRRGITVAQHQTSQADARSGAAWPWFKDDVLLWQAGYLGKHRLGMLLAYHDEHTLYRDQGLDPIYRLLQHGVRAQQIKELFWGSSPAAGPQARANPAGHNDCVKVIDQGNLLVASDIRLQMQANSLFRIAANR
jgi:hypothetical protein